ncbi:hypothetical protein C4552_00640 [Candidatus Parcubacteria bacterium]|nr:MAG: hypothetical protein C4552_00640 [Candidatus Parcubacteria bacterium]
MIDPRPAFIPHPTVQPQSRPLMIIGANWFFTVGMIVFVLGALATAGVFGYKGYLQRVRAGEMDAVRAREQQLRSSQALEEITAFSQSLAAAQNLLQDHVFPTSILRLLEDTTHQNVQLRTLSFNRGERRVALSGIARSYQTVAEQIMVLESSPHVERVTFGGLASDAQNRVSFTMTLTLRPSAFGYREP